MFEWCVATRDFYFWKKNPHGIFCLLLVGCRIKEGKRQNAINKTLKKLIWELWNQDFLDVVTVAVIILQGKGINSLNCLIETMDNEYVNVLLLDTTLIQVCWSIMWNLCVKRSASTGSCCRFFLLMFLSLQWSVIS